MYCSQCANRTMVQVKTYAFITLMISIFLLIGALITFAVAIPAYINDQPYSIKALSPNLCTVTNTSFSDYPCTCGKSCATTCCEATWFLTCFDPQLPDQIHNTLLYNNDYRSYLQHNIDVYIANVTFIAYLDNSGRAHWIPVDGAYSIALLSVSSTVVGFLILIMSVSAAIVAHFDRIDRRSGNTGSDSSNSSVTQSSPLAFVMQIASQFN